jgi:hypothetical protein
LTHLCDFRIEIKGKTFAVVAAICIQWHVGDYVVNCL